MSTKYKEQYLEVNWSNIMESIQLAKKLRDYEVILKNKEGEYHKVKIKFSNPFSSKKNICEIEINEMDMGGEIRDFGDAYDLIRSCVDVP